MEVQFCKFILAKKYNPYMACLLKAASIYTITRAYCLSYLHILHS